MAYDRDSDNPNSGPLIGELLDPEPPRPSERDQIHRVVQWLSRFMDSMFEIPVLGWRFGWDAVIGLVPGIGDAATTLVSVYIVALAARAGVPRVTVVRMALNVAIDMLLGAVPFLGDLADVWWKANQRNAALLSQRLKEVPEHGRAPAADWLFVSILLIALLALFAGIVITAALVVAALWRLVFGA